MPSGKFVYSMEGKMQDRETVRGLKFCKKFRITPFLPIKTTLSQTIKRVCNNKPKAHSNLFPHFYTISQVWAN